MSSKPFGNLVVTDLGSILDQLMSAVIVLDEKHRVRYVNHAAELALGRSRSQCLESPIANLVRESHLTEDVFDRCRKSSQPVAKREAVIKLGHGKPQLIADYAISPIEQNHILLELRPHPATHNISRGDSVKQTQTTTRHLVRGLAHEIKNPLGGIRGAAQLLSAELRDPSQAEYIDVIIDEVDRLRNLVDRLLRPSELPSFQTVNLHEVVERVIRLKESSKKATHVQFTREYDPSVPEIEADASQLVQAVLNIVNNACDAVADSQNATVSFSTSVERSMTIGETQHRLVAVLNVSDNGQGIPAELRDRIFYPMISSRANGTGLGLPITQAIVGQHNGLIDFESEPGHTVFSIYLPIKQQSE